ncbi:PTR2-domain-containing protein [Tothia fuscella]|uniref:PTR2-domain-containing protein n=1 Tax=Tothia fuscella TaxID=1048955 RepID=A0A9P4NH91_9PEZI|nr:PTR2-domain-containing protein [Tothia fuscella]
MSSGGPNAIDIAEVAKAHVPALPSGAALHHHPNAQEQKDACASDAASFESSEVSDEDLHTLRRVKGKIPWTAYTITFIEFCERFSYYGTIVVWTNYIQQPLPHNSNTGANHGSPDFRSGAFGLGQKASTAATTFNSFWAYFMPIIGAYIADEYLGRFNTILGAIFVAIFGHTVLVVSALPPVIVHTKQAFGCFWAGMIIMGIGTGGFKSNISPLIAEQALDTKMKIITTKRGERVILDPAVTIQHIYLYFYFMINCGSLIGQIAMVYAEQNVGFWLAFTLPTVMFCICPMVMFACSKYYVKSPPTGSVFGKALKLWTLAAKGCWSPNPIITIKNMRRMTFWENVKPSKLGAEKPSWMTFDDHWVDEVRRGFKACTVFLWYPFYWLTYNQMTNNLVSQAATMELNGLPNDLVQNIDPLTLIILIPFCDRFLYPYLRQRGIRFTAIKRIFVGFMFGAVGMVIACIIQYFIYTSNPCGSHANGCSTALKKAGDTTTKPYALINVWVQTPAYVFIAFSEIFASITGLEYAFVKAPQNMRSLVMSMFLFTNAISSALAQALVPISDDPNLVINYGVVAGIAFFAGVGFWYTNKGLDAQDDALNRLPVGKVRSEADQPTTGL